VIEFGPVREDGRAQLSGMAGVNRFFGDYSFAPGEGAIGGLTVGQIGSTRMAGPPELMEFEAALLETLKTARTVRVDGDAIVIDCTDAEIRLVRVVGRR
jgi:heat shock protein HslJ